MQAEKQYDFRFKIVLIGDTQVGKSSMMSQYYLSTFSSAYVMTIGVDFSIPLLNVDNFRIRLEMWDTSGQERFRTIVKSYFRGIDGFIIVYDITNRSSFLNLPNWIAELSPDVPKLIVGNKSDLKEKREVSFEEAREFGEKVGIKIIEVSAKDNINLEDVFSTIARQIGIKQDIKNRQPYVPPVAIETEKQYHPPEQQHEIFRIVMIGDCRVGKSNFLSQLGRNEFNSDYVSTIGVDFTARTFTYKGENLKFQIWDTSGDPRFKSIVQSYYKGAEAIILIYDITNRNSFINLDTWLQSVKENNGDRALKIVAGNKNDLEKERKVGYAEGEAYAKTIGAYFFEFSAKNDDFQSHFIEAFQTIFESLAI